MDDILFCRWRISKISYFVDGKYRRYPILSMENIEDILRSKERYFIFLFYPILSKEIYYNPILSKEGEILFLSICPGDSMDKIRRISKISKEIYYNPILSKEERYYFYQFIQGIVWTK